MYLGKIVEIGAAQEVYAQPLHPYTQALLSAVPIPDPRENAAREQIILEGDVPSPANPPSGLPLPHPLPDRDRDLLEVEPRAGRLRRRHLAACHHPVRASRPGRGAARPLVLSEARPGLSALRHSLDRPESITQRGSGTFWRSGSALRFAIRA